MPSRSATRKALPAGHPEAGATAAKAKGKETATGRERQGHLFDAAAASRSGHRADVPPPAAPAGPPRAQQARIQAQASSPRATPPPPGPRDRTPKVSATSSLTPAELRWHPDLQPRPERWLLGGSPLLTVALAGSVLLHLVVLSIHFRPELSRLLDRAPSLEVTLVNARSKERPAKADVLAQANLDGGGNTDADRRAKTPLPVVPKESPRTEVTLPAEQVEMLERQARDVLTQMRSVPVLPPAPKSSEGDVRADAPSMTELTQRTLEAMRLEAQVARELDAYQKRPKRRFVGARAEEYRFARYVEDWRLKVERIGNLNYPDAARQLKLYGSLLLSVAIRADGSLENVEVHRSSGQRVLDAAAVRIVEMGAPYAPLPADIRRDTDVLVITRTWSFTRGEELHTD